MKKPVTLLMISSTVCALYIFEYGHFTLEICSNFARVRNYVTIKRWQIFLNYFDKLFQDNSNWSNKLRIRDSLIWIMVLTNFVFLWNMILYHDQYLVRNHVWIQRKRLIKLNCFLIWQDIFSIICRITLDYLV